MGNAPSFPPKYPPKRPNEHSVSKSLSCMSSTFSSVSSPSSASSLCDPSVPSDSCCDASFSSLKVFQLDDYYEQIILLASKFDGWAFGEYVRDCKVRDEPCSFFTDLDLFFPSKQNKEAFLFQLKSWFLIKNETELACFSNYVLYDRELPVTRYLMQMDELQFNMNIVVSFCFPVQDVSANLFIYNGETLKLGQTWTQLHFANSSNKKKEKERQEDIRHRITSVLHPSFFLKKPIDNFAYETLQRNGWRVSSRPQIINEYLNKFMSAFLADPTVIFALLKNNKQSFQVPFVVSDEKEQSKQILLKGLKGLVCPGRLIYVDADCPSYRIWKRRCECWNKRHEYQYNLSCQELTAIANINVEKDQMVVVCDSRPFFFSFFSGLPNPEKAASQFRQECFYHRFLSIEQVQDCVAAQTKSKKIILLKPIEAVPGYIFVHY